MSELLAAFEAHPAHPFLMPPSTYYRSKLPINAMVVELSRTPKSFDIRGIYAIGKDLPLALTLG